MYSRSFTAVLAATMQILASTWACAPPLNASEAFEIGNDGPADPATVGTSLNHFALLVNDIDASVHFYGKILGMRHVFTFHATETYQIYYMSYSQGGHNGTGFQTGEQLLAQKGNTEGQLELIYNKNCSTSSTNSSITSTTQQVNTFSHVGLVVPDIVQFQDRMEQFGVPILKRAGEDFETTAETQAAHAFGFEDDIINARRAVKGLGPIGFSNFLIVKDPDGNAVEIQPQS